ncbi:MAG: molybdate ABC transporter substrate-binding protein [Sandaracinaceae bacterium]
MGALSTTRRPGLRLGLGAALLGLTIGCAGPSSGAGGRVPLTVFAASSLTEAFQAIERGYERAHPDVDVQLTFAGSQVLRLQIEEGASVDVFASASERHVAALVRAGRVAPALPFAENELVVIVPVDPPSPLRRFDQLDRADRIVLGTAAVPVGIYAREVLARAEAALGPTFVAAVRARVVSEESNARLVRAKVELGEADAAIVYRTDAASSDAVRVLPIPEALGVRARYQIGPLASAPHPAEAERFVAYVRSAPGRGALRRQGFVAAAD